MDDHKELWADYGHSPRPANIGAFVGETSLGDLDDEVQDVVSSYMGLGADIDAANVARLGLALNEIMRVLPEIQPAETERYFRRLAALARSALDAIARHDA